MAGIDLGATRSAIATMENGTPRVIKVSPTEPLLPSVVFIDGRGATFLGAKAREAMLTCHESEGNGYTGWRPRMGQDDLYQFTAARKSLTALELSALIIGELLRVYRRDMKEDLLSCVVTVPAKFDHSACNATNKAAELAGLRHHPLLQEPIAAALAYGFTTGDQRANWLVFDLGGGTLDISLLAVRDGRLLPIEDGQAGDSHLGAAAFDRDLLDFVLGSNDPAQHEQYRRLQSDYEPLRRQYRLEHFSEQTQRTAWNRLLLACEEAKIALSKRQEAIVELDQPLCNDDNGREVRVEVHVTRAAYEKLIAQDVERAVDLCESLLRRNGMTGASLDQLILLGGVTRTPYVQQVLQERLKIELKMTVDPMTAVALGAALHSEMIEIPGHLRAKPITSTQGISLRLEYEPTSKQPSAPVGGVIENATEEPSKLRVEVRRHAHPWTSGHVPVDETGRFIVDLPLVELGRPYQSRFTTQVIDSSGQVIATAEEPRIWHPVPKVEAVLASTLSICTGGNKTCVLMPRGTALPARCAVTSFVQERIVKGTQEPVVSASVLQAVPSLLGEEETEDADCQLRLGCLVIRDDDPRITMDLARGTEIEVTMEVDESQQVRVLVYIPVLNEEFEGQIVPQPYILPLKDLELRFSRELDRLETVREIQRVMPDSTVARALEIIEAAQTTANIKSQLLAARQGESSATSKAMKLILELAAMINQIWPLQTRGRLRRQLCDLRTLAAPGHLGEISRMEAALDRPRCDLGEQELGEIARGLSKLDSDVREGHFHMLLTYVLFFGGSRVSARKHAIHQKAMELAQRLLRAGAPESLTAADIAEIQGVNRRFAEAFPEVNEPPLQGFLAYLARQQWARVPERIDPGSVGGCPPPLFEPTMLIEPSPDGPQ